MERTMTGNSFNSVKASIAEKIEQVACSLGRQTEEGSVLGPYSQQASAWLHQSAAYVRDFDVKQADADLRKQISNNPGKSVLIGVGAGLMLGLMIRRR